MWGNLRQHFVTGLLVWLPVGVTLWFLLWLTRFFDDLFWGVIDHLHGMFPWLASILSPLRRVPGLGMMLVIILMVVTGVLVANMVGQWLLRQWNQWMTRIPVVRTVYSSVKQVSDTLFSGSGQAFSKALLIEYPRRGVWTIAFLTGEPAEGAAMHLMGDFVSVFVPTAPNPTSGYFLMLPRADVVELQMSVDDALKVVISMGVVVPPATLPISDVAVAPGLNG